jgi:hypothetical protein
MQSHMQSQPSEPGAKLDHRWSGIIDSAYSSSNTSPYGKIVTSLVVGVAAAAVLVMIYPPFACKPISAGQLPQLSPPRICCWALLAAVATALLSYTDLFKSTN